MARAITHHAGPVRIGEIKLKSFERTQTLSPGAIYRQQSGITYPPSAILIL
jgi:hypothetical protein